MKSYKVLYSIISGFYHKIEVSGNNAEHAEQECCRLTGIHPSSIIKTIKI